MERNMDMKYHLRVCGDVGVFRIGLTTNGGRVDYILLVGVLFYERNVILLDSNHYETPLRCSVFLTSCCMRPNTFYTGYVTPMRASVE